MQFPKVRALRQLTMPLALLVAVAGCDCDPEIVASSGILELSPKSVDFGIGCLTDTNTRPVILRNIGNSDLTVLSLDVTGVGYTLVNEKPEVIPAQSEIVVEVAFTPQVAEEFGGVLKVVTDAAENAEQKSSLIGQGFAGKRHDFRVNCLCDANRECGLKAGQTNVCAFLSFTDVRAGETHEATAQLTNAGCAPIEITESQIIAGPGDTSGGEDAKLFSIVGPGSFTLHGGVTRELTVRFAAPKAEVAPDVRLQLSSTDPGRPSASLGLLANSTLPQLMVDPEILTFFLGQSGVPLEKEFDIVNTGSGDLDITEVTLAAEDGTTDYALAIPGGSGAFTLGSSGLGNNRKTVKAVYTSSGVGRDRATITIKGGGETRQVRLLGGTEPIMVVKWLDGGVERDPPVDFGNVAVGSKGNERTVRILNPGRAPLTISAVTLPALDNAGLAFKLSGFTPGEVAVNGQLEFNIVHDDVVTLRDDRAKIQITSDDPVDESVAGQRLVDVQSANEPNFAPVVSIEVSTAPSITRTLTVDGSGSTGPEGGDTLTFKWQLTRKPAGSTARLVDAVAATTTIISDDGAHPDVIGNYVVKLEVTDQFGSRNLPLTQSINVGGN